MSLPATPFVVSTDEDAEAFLQLVAEEGLQACVRIGRRLWIISEDEHGNFWASGMPCEDDEEDGGLLLFDDLWSESRTSAATVVHLEPW